MIFDFSSGDMVELEGMVGDLFVCVQGGMREGMEMEMKGGLDGGWTVWTPPTSGVGALRAGFELHARPKGGYFLLTSDSPAYQTNISV